MNAKELFEFLYPEEEKGVEIRFGKRFIIAFAEHYAKQSKPDVSEDMKIDDFLKEEMNWTDRDLEYRPVIGYWKVVELLQKWSELTKF